LHAFAQDRNLQCSAAMTEPRVVPVLALSLLLTACGGLTTLPPTAPSAAVYTQVSVPASQAATVPAPTHAIGPDVPPGLVPTTQVIQGSVGPLARYAAPCYVGLYACEKYRLTLQHDGAVEVTLSWQGGSRAMLIQLYRAGAGLVHEDLSQNGQPNITFRRVGLESMEYELRVVNWEPEVAHTFTLTYTTWQ
jgi:hypothetical protein